MRLFGKNGILGMFKIKKKTEELSTKPKAIIRKLLAEGYSLDDILLIAQFMSEEYWEKDHSNIIEDAMENFDDEDFKKNYYDAKKADETRKALEVKLNPKLYEKSMEMVEQYRQSRMTLSDINSMGFKMIEVAIDMLPPEKVQRTNYPDISGTIVSRGMKKKEKVNIKKRTHEK